MVLSNKSVENYADNTSKNTFSLTFLSGCTYSCLASSSTCFSPLRNSTFSFSSTAASDLKYLTDVLSLSKENKFCEDTLHCLPFYSKTQMPYSDCNALPSTYIYESDKTPVLSSSLNALSSSSSSIDITKFLNSLLNFMNVDETISEYISDPKSPLMFPSKKNISSSFHIKSYEHISAKKQVDQLNKYNKSLCCTPYNSTNFRNDDSSSFFSDVSSKFCRKRHKSVIPCNATRKGSWLFQFKSTCPRKGIKKGDSGERMHNKNIVNFVRSSNKIEKNVKKYNLFSDTFTSHSNSSMNTIVTSEISSFMPSMLPVYNEFPELFSCSPFRTPSFSSQSVCSKYNGSTLKFQQKLDSRAIPQFFNKNFSDYLRPRCFEKSYYLFSLLRKKNRQIQKNYREQILRRNNFEFFDKTTRYITPNNFCASCLNCLFDGNYDEVNFNAEEKLPHSSLLAFPDTDDFCSTASFFSSSSIFESSFNFYGCSSNLEGSVAPQRMQMQSTSFDSIIMAGIYKNEMRELKESGFLRKYFQNTSNEMPLFLTNVYDNSSLCIKKEATDENNAEIRSVDPYEEVIRKEKIIKGDGKERQIIHQGSNKQSKHEIEFFFLREKQQKTIHTISAENKHATNTCLVNYTTQSLLNKSNISLEKQKTENRFFAFKEKIKLMHEEFMYLHENEVNHKEQKKNQKQISIKKTRQSNELNYKFEEAKQNVKRINARFNRSNDDRSDELLSFNHSLPCLSFSSSCSYIHENSTCFFQSDGKKKKNYNHFLYSFSSKDCTDLSISLSQLSMPSSSRQFKHPTTTIPITYSIDNNNTKSINVSNNENENPNNTNDIHKKNNNENQVKKIIPFCANIYTPNNSSVLASSDSPIENISIMNFTQSNNVLNICDFSSAFSLTSSASLSPAPCFSFQKEAQMLRNDLFFLSSSISSSNCSKQKEKQKITAKKYSHFFNWKESKKLLLNKIVDAENYSVDGFEYKKWQLEVIHTIGPSSVGCRKQEMFKTTLLSGRKIFLKKIPAYLWEEQFDMYDKWDGEFLTDGENYVAEAAATAFLTKYYSGVCPPLMAIVIERETKTKISVKKDINKLENNVIALPFNDSYFDGSSSINLFSFLSSVENNLAKETEKKQRKNVFSTLIHSLPSFCFTHFSSEFSDVHKLVSIQDIKQKINSGNKTKKVEIDEKSKQFIKQKKKNNFLKISSITEDNNQNEIIKKNSILHNNINRRNRKSIILNEIKYVVLVSQVCGFDLLDFFEERRKKKIKTTPTEKRSIQRLVVELLDVTHNAGLSHLDFTPENILINKEKNKIWLCDFAKCTVLHTNNPLHLKIPDSNKNNSSSCFSSLIFSSSSFSFSSSDTSPHSSTYIFSSDSPNSSLSSLNSLKENSKEVKTKTQNKKRKENNQSNNSIKDKIGRVKEITNNRIYEFMSCEPTIGKSAYMPPECWLIVSKLYKMRLTRPFIQLAKISKYYDRLPFYFYVRKADIYMCGILLFWLWSEGLIWQFSDIYQDKEYCDLVKSGMNFDIFSECTNWSKTLKELLKNALDPHPCKRISLDRLLSHPWWNEKLV